MKTFRTTVPVYQTLSLARILGRGSDGWKTCFPFSAPHGMWTFNGRTALHIGLKTLGLAPGSTVLFPNYFQGVEIDTLLHNGHKLRFYRVDKRLRPDLEHVKSLLDDNVSAFYLIQYFGIPQDMNAIGSLVQENDLKLIEDCALAMLSRDESGWLGSFGDVSLFSIYKTLALPHGGYVVSKTPLPAVQLKSPPLMTTLSQITDLLQEHWRARGWFRFEQTMQRIAALMRRALPGTRSVVRAGGITWNPSVLDFAVSGLTMFLMDRNDPLQAIEIRRRNFELLAKRLQDHAQCMFNELPPHACPLFFPVLVKSKLQAMEQLQRRGVGSINLWWDRHSACPTDLAEEVMYLREHILELPIHQSLSEFDVERVADEFIAANIESLN